MKIDNRSNSILGTFFAILIAIGTSLTMIGFTLCEKGKSIFRKLVGTDSEDDDE